MFAGTVSQPATLRPNGQSLEHRGVDYVMPYTETDVFKDLRERSTIDAMLLFQYSYNLYVLDLTQNPPVNIGPDKMAFLTGLFGYTYRWSPELMTGIRVGGVIGSPPPRDPDQRTVISPAATAELGYTKGEWSLLATTAYTYGTVNPRLGAGPSASAGLVIAGTPSRVGNWKNFSLLVNAQGSHSSLLTGVGQSTMMDTGAADAQFRYAVNNWLGLLGGYQIRYARYQTVDYVPPFAQHIVFFGVSGYWSTDRNIPVLTQFAAPIAPPT
jgi:hypothetical protein